MTKRICSIEGCEPRKLVINMQSGGDQCCICGEWDYGYGVPVGVDGRIISNDSTQDWAGKPACRKCHDEHAQGKHVGTYPSY